MVDFVVVSSDNPTILDEATKAGAVAINRPADLASDSAVIEDAIMHALQTFSGDHQVPATLVLLQPTSPLRKS